MATSFTLSLDSPDFFLEKTDSGNGYRLRFQQEGAEVTVRLSGFALEAIARQATALLPSPDQKLPDIEEEATWRQAAWPLTQLSDNAWRILLREIPSDSLICALWYLKDLKVAKRVMDNLSERAAAMLTEDMIARFQGKNPDTSPAPQVLKGRQCLQEMLSILERLMTEGQVEEDYQA